MEGAMGMGPMAQMANPQFVNPTKVIHMRNLPFDVRDDELRDLCAPWGQVVAIKSKVGTNRNQAFVEFADVQSSVAIVSHYQHNVDGARIRGRPAYLNFSARDHLTNLTSTDMPMPVVHIQMTDILPELREHITLDLLHMVVGAFGPVVKAATHPAADGGLLAWVQFPDAATAAQVKATLQGQRIPAHLLNDHPQPPTLHMTFSPYPDLPITVQSYCTRDFVNTALPWGDPDLNAISVLLPTGEISNVLTINFDGAVYPVTLDSLYTICSTYGAVQKIHIFEREGRTVALVQYPDALVAQVAKQALDGHAMYEGGHNVMRPVFSKHRNLVIKPGERSRDYTQPEGGAAAAPGAAAGAGAATAAGSMGVPGGAAPAAEGGWSSMVPGGAAQAALQQQQQQEVIVTGEDYVRAHEEVLSSAGVYAPATLGRSPAGPPLQQQQQQQQQPGLPPGGPRFGAPFPPPQQQMGPPQGPPPPQQGFAPPNGPPGGYGGRPSQPGFMPQHMMGPPPHGIGPPGGMSMAPPGPGGMGYGGPPMRPPYGRY